MNQNIQISVKGTTPDSGVVEVKCAGKYGLINEVEYIKYDEILEEAGVKISNMIKIAKGSVEMSKKGPMSSKMIFIPDSTTDCIYETPYGNIPMKVHTKSVNIIRTEEKMRVLLNYALGISDTQSIDCEVDILVTNHE